jgi:hypothetical protein
MGTIEETYTIFQFQELSYRAKQLELSLRATESENERQKRDLKRREEQEGNRISILLRLT